MNAYQYAHIDSSYSAAVTNARLKRKMVEGWMNDYLPGTIIILSINYNTVMLPIQLMIKSQIDHIYNNDSSNEVRSKSHSDYVV
jgi:hypothetical protein